jgi:hypothetical protein
MRLILYVLLADSDYQLVSEAQTPGLNNQTPPELPSYEEHPKRNNVSRNGDLFENYKNNRDRYPPAGHPVSLFCFLDSYLSKAAQQEILGGKWRIWCPKNRKLQLHM